MSKPKDPGTQPDQKEPEKNLHIEVPQSFHQRLKMLCVVKESTLKAYALQALEEKVARDEAEMRGGK